MKEETTDIMAGLVDRKAERALLASIIASEGHALDTRDGIFNTLIGVDDKAFTTSLHKTIYTAARACHLDGRPTDPTGLSAKLREMGELSDDAFGMLYELMGEAVAPANAEEVARAVLELHQRREIGRVLSDGYKQAVTGSGSYAEIAADISTSVASVVDGSIKSESIVDGATGLGDTVAQLLGWTETPPKGLTTGFQRLDEVTGGLRKRQVWVIAGRPGQGKTVLGIQIARHVVRVEGVSVLFVSMEMPRDELFSRVISNECNIRHKELLAGTLSESDQQKVVRLWEEEQTRQEQEGGAHFIVDDEGPQTIGEIYLKARKAIREYGVGLVVLDYLQEARADNPTGNRTEDTTQVSQATRAMARRLNIPVIELAQLNRGVSDRADSRPRVSDLKQSGQIEQDGNVIVLIDNPPASDNNNEGVDNSATLIVGKNRNGRNNVDVDVQFDGAHARFVDGEEIARLAQSAAQGASV